MLKVTANPAGSKVVMRRNEQNDAGSGVMCKIEVVTWWKRGALLPFISCFFC